jgi:iron(III) transport system permease protein
VAAAIGLLYAAPIGYLVVRNLQDAGDVVAVLSSSEALRALGRTVLLGVLVSVTAACAGTALAWLTTRTDLPLRRVVAVLAALPLVIPSFVGAAALLAAVAPGGLVDEVAPQLGVDRLPRIEGLWSAWLVLSLFTYPYVYLPVAARLSSLPASVEESARLLGRSSWGAFRSMVVPQAADAISAGALLVFLYTLSDFGAVAQLRYRTLTVEIFDARLFNQREALALGLLLAVATLVLVVLERGVARRRPPLPSTAGRGPLQSRLGRWRWPAVALTTAWIGLALFAPLAVLGTWAVRGLTTSSTVEQADVAAMVEPMANSAVLSVVTAVVAVVLLLPVALAVVRRQSRLGGAARALVVASFALPGLLVALAIVFWILDVPAAGALYQTVPVLVGAYVLHFGAQALGPAEFAVRAVPLQLRDAAATLGAGGRRRFLTVDLPLMRPALVAGGGLVVLSTMKELPATLLLRPTRVSTLAVEIWDARETAQWGQLGLASLLLVAVAGALTWAFVIRHASRIASGTGGT